MAAVIVRCTCTAGDQTQRGITIACAAVDHHHATLTGKWRTPSVARATARAACASNDADRPEVPRLLADPQDSMAETFEKIMNKFRDICAFGRANVEAAVKASELAAQALDGIGSEFSAARRAHECRFKPREGLRALGFGPGVLVKAAVAPFLISGVPIYSERRAPPRRRQGTYG